MRSTETWYYIKDNMLYKHIENDGYAYMRNGPEERDIPLCHISVATEFFPKEYAQAKGAVNAIR
jgi:hypothetical protein